MIATGAGRFKLSYSNRNILIVICRFRSYNFIQGEQGNKQTVGRWRRAFALADLVDNHVASADFALVELEEDVVGRGLSYTI